MSDINIKSCGEIKRSKNREMFEGIRYKINKKKKS